MSVHPDASATSNLDIDAGDGGGVALGGGGDHLGPPKSIKITKNHKTIVRKKIVQTSETVFPQMSNNIEKYIKNMFLFTE